MIETNLQLKVNYLLIFGVSLHFTKYSVIDFAIAAENREDYRLLRLGQI